MYIPACASPQYLVSGPDPILDEHMTASSWLPYDYYDGGDHVPSEARLNKTRQEFSGGYNAGIWAPAVNDTNQWIQVSVYKSV